MDNLNFSFAIDKTSCFDNAINFQKILSHSDYEINNMIAQIPNSLHYSSGKTFLDLNSFTQSMIPVPKLKLLSCSSLYDEKYKLYQTTIKSLWKPMLNIDHRHGRFLGLQFSYRGNVNENELTKINQLNVKNSSYFGSNFKKINSSINKTPFISCGKKIDEMVGITSIANSTAASETLKRCCEQFTAIFRRKSWLHLYTAEGIDEMQFIEAESSMNDMVSLYQQCQDD